MCLTLLPLFHLLRYSSLIYAIGFRPYGYSMMEMPYLLIFDLLCDLLPICNSLLAKEICIILPVWNLISSIPNRNICAFWFIF